MRSSGKSRCGRSGRVSDTQTASGSAKFKCLRVCVGFSSLFWLSIVSGPGNNARRPPFWAASTGGRAGWRQDKQLVRPTRLWLSDRPSDSRNRWLFGAPARPALRSSRNSSSGLRINRGANTASLIYILREQSWPTRRPKQRATVLIM